jgi:23S rRNA (uracil1939-C5)-methyltransferase
MNPAVEATIEHLSTDGRGVTRVEGTVYFVSGGLPGDKVLLNLDARTKPPSAGITQMLQESPHRVTHPCPHFGPCCGSVWGCLAYEEQLKAKRELVERTLRKSLGPVEVLPTIASPEPWHYRNRITLTAWPESGRLQLGFQSAARSESGVPVRTCRLAKKELAVCLEKLSEFFAATKLHDLPFPRRIQLHQTMAGVGALFVFPDRITDSQAKAWLALLAAIEIPGGIWLASGTRAGIVDHHLPRHQSANALPMVTRCLGQNVTLDPTAFCQTNPGAAERVAERLQTLGRERHFTRVWDLYGGFGALGLASAAHDQPLMVFEITPQSEPVLHLLASVLHRRQPEFIAGDLLKTFPPQARDLGKNDLVVMDPPRSGAHPVVLKALVKSRVRTVIYLSCNPARLGRDLQILQAGGFTPSEIQPYDFFPQTPSIETLAIVHRA